MSYQEKVDRVVLRSIKSSSSPRLRIARGGHEIGGYLVKHNKAHRLKMEAHAKIKKEAKEIGFSFSRMNSFWSYVMDMDTKEVLNHWEWMKKATPNTEDYDWEDMGW